MIKIKEKNDIIENIETTKEKKVLYGEVFTPFILVEKILDLLDKDIYKNKNNKFLDPGAGKGNFSIVLYYKLLENLDEEEFNDKEDMKNHIIENMLFMVELQEENVKVLREIFGNKANIINEDYLTTNKLEDIDIDVVVGNPPFNFNGQKKVPTNYLLNKKADGATIWGQFVKKGLSLLKNEGYMAMITPTLWLKPDKDKLNDLLLYYKLLKIESFTNTEVNKYFKGNAQTPCCIFSLKKVKGDREIEIKDVDAERYIRYNVDVKGIIPMYGTKIIKQINRLKIDNIKVIKTNCPPKDVEIRFTKSEKHTYKNISTCILDDRKPSLVLSYSNKPLKYHGQQKIVMAHKMYGFPFIDREGEFGVANRDNYVIIKENYNDLIKLQKFLSTRTALYLFEATRYRMKYLEKYAFELIPDISLLKDFPKTINDNTIAEYFGLDEMDRKHIKNLHKRDYLYFN